MRVRVSPSARGDGRGVVSRHGTGWKVRVAAVPEAGKANEALVRLLAERLRLPRRNVKIVSGHTGRDKTVELAQIDAQEAARRLAQASETR